MNALQSYYSDDSDEGSRSKRNNKTAESETNYDNVGMDISEGSEDEAEKSVPSSTQKSLTKTHSPNSPPRNKSESKPSSRSRQSPERPSQSREGSSSSSSRESREDKDHKKVHDSRDRRRHDHHDRRDRKDRDDYRSGRSRRDRSRSRERRHRRSRSRSRSRERYRHGNDRERRRATDMRREAQQKLAALKSNPNFDQSEMLRRTMQEQVVDIEKKTGITIPSYYNPATMNPAKLAEQERKKRLLWGNKAKPAQPEAAPAVSEVKPVETAGQSTVWANTSFINDQDGKMAEKFKRLMGVKASGSSDDSSQKEDKLKEQESFFVNMERQYEVARLATHTQKGVGLGFSSQSYLPK